MKFKRYKNEEGCFEWKCGKYTIIRSGGTDRRGHFTYNLGAYGVVFDEELPEWFGSLAEAKNHAESIG